MPTMVPLFRSFQDSVPKVLHTDKPLPPTPHRRKASSVYSSGHDNLIDSYLGLVSGDEANPTDIYLQPVIYSSSTPQIPITDTSKRSAYQPLQEPLSAPLRLENQYKPTPRPTPVPRAPGDNRRPKQSPTVSQTFVQQTKVFDHIAAKRQFDAQRAKPPPRLPTPPGFKAVLYDAEQKRLAKPPPYRTTTDGVDQSLVPPPLSLRKSQQSDEVESSHFSISSDDSDDSDDEGTHTGIRGSVRAYARKALHLHKTTPQEKETKRVMSVASAKYPFMDPAASSGRRPSKFGSISSERRASIQQGMNNMYEAVAKLSTWSPIATTNNNSKKRNTIPREVRSPAIPITPYQQLGTKAWDPPPKSPKSPSKSLKQKDKEKDKDRTSKVSKTPFAILTPGRKFDRGPATAPLERQSGKGKERGNGEPARWSRGKIKRTASEKRRDELRSRIVVVKDADQRPDDGKVERWM